MGPHKQKFTMSRVLNFTAESNQEAAAGVIERLNEAYPEKDFQLEEVYPHEYYFVIKAIEYDNEAEVSYSHEFNLYSHDNAWWSCNPILEY